MNKIRPLYVAPRNPRLWSGETVFCVASEAALRDLPKIAKSGRVLITGDLFSLADKSFVDGVFFGNRHVLNKKRREVAENEGDCEFFTTVQQARRYKGFNVFTHRSHGLTMDDSRLAHNGSDAAALINLAVILGANTVVLCGFGFQDPKYRTSLRKMRSVPLAANRLKVRIISTDHETAIDAFEYSSLDRVLAGPAVIADDTDPFVIEDDIEPDVPVLSEPEAVEATDDDEPIYPS